MPEPFAVFQYYRYGVRHALVAQKKQNVALVMDFGGGTFDTCLADDGKGNKTWLGDVPFNVVKQVSIDDSKNVITIEVSLYSFGH